MPATPLLRKVDAVQLPVPDLEAALAFYRDRLGHALVWRTTTAAGLRVPDSEAELVLQTERPEPEVDWLVGSAEAAAARWVAAGGTLRVAPFDIQIGRCVVVADPFGNILVLLDASRGPLQTDAQGRVTGNAAPDPGAPTAEP
jgi:catechol 2,3-dioxygenase-like lactoylglutathione lyase family enzyme